MARSLALGRRLHTSLVCAAVAALQYLEYGHGGGGRAELFAPRVSDLRISVRRVLSRCTRLQFRWAPLFPARVVVCEGTPSSLVHGQRYAIVRAARARVLAPQRLSGHIVPVAPRVGAAPLQPPPDQDVVIDDRIVPEVE